MFNTKQQKAMYHRGTGDLDRLPWQWKNDNIVGSDQPYDRNWYRSECDSDGYVYKGCSR